MSETEISILINKFNQFIIQTSSFMRKVIFALLMLCAVSSQAQNLQVMYDFGNGRQNVTSTLEMFKPDKWGNTFFFVDMEFNQGTENHPSSAYMEIARCLKFWNGLMKKPKFLCNGSNHLNCMKRSMLFWKSAKLISQNSTK